MADDNRGQPPLGSDQLVAVLLVAGVAVFVFHRRHTLLHQLTVWVQEHQILLPATAGLLQIPHVGGLDVPRLLIVGGLLLLTVLTAKIAARARRRT